MSRQELKQKLEGWFRKIGTYKYALIVLLVGVVLILLPVREKNVSTQTTQQVEDKQDDIAEQLEELLSHIQGAGKTKVLLTMATGPSQEYQLNTEIQYTQDGERRKSDTVLVSSGSGTEEALVTTTTFPSYRGAVVVCEGADSAAVRLNIIHAVSSLTGLGSDKIAVIKMNSD